MLTLLPGRSKKKAAKAAQAASAAALGDDAEEERYRPIDLKLVRRMAQVLRPFWRMYALGAGIGLVHVFLEMLSPRFTQEIIDHCTAWGDAAAGRAAAEGHGVVARIAAWLVRVGGFGSPLADRRGAIAGVVAIVVIWACVIACSVVLQRYTIIVMTAAGERVQFSIRRKLFSHLQALSMS